MKLPKSAKKNMTSFIPYIAAFIFLTFFELLLLTGTASIPKKSIQKNVQKSAVYMTRNQVFFAYNQADHASIIDHYADSILLNIVYNYDSGHPVRSALSSSYYYTPDNNENYNLLFSVSKGEKTNYDYTRYWHGSAIIVKPLLIFTDINGIYIILGIILAALFILLAILVRKNTPEAFIPLCISFCCISPWYISMSMEYIWCFILTFSFSIYIYIAYKKRGLISSLAFFIIGNLTAYFDFLTTETLTLLLPAALLIVLEYESGKFHALAPGLKLLTGRAIQWSCGYILAWVSKWGIASVVLEKNVFSQALTEANHRFSGAASDLDGLSLRLSALAKNVSCLLPFNFIPTHAYVWFLVFILLFLMVYYVLKKPGSIPATKLFFIISIIPYIRYFVLGNHSYLHYFFTYRAQMVSIFSLCMVLYYGTCCKAGSCKRKT